MPLDGVTPFPPDFAARYRRNGCWADRPLIAHFGDAFAAYADRVAFVSGKERITYGEVAQRSQHLARHLLDRGYRPLDRVVMHLPNVPEFVYLYFALQHVGAVPLMALPLHRQMEIGHYIEFIEARGYAIADRVADFDYIALAHEIRSSADTLREVFVVGADVPQTEPFVSIRALLATEPQATAEDLARARTRIDPTDPCCFQLSGGTTGIPKVIPRTHNDYVYNSLISGGVNDIRPDDALLVVLPIAHNFPLASPGIQAFLLAGARCVLSTSTRSRDLLQLIEQERITHLELVPALTIRWLDDPALRAHDLSSVRIVNSGGQKWQAETKVRIEEVFANAQVQEVFGMAEGLLFLPRIGDPYEVRIDTVGRPVSPEDEVRLVDDDGNDVKNGEVGEMICRGPYTLRGYFRAEEHNARVFTGDGFFKTGDLMRRHRSGNYVVEGRKKDVINRGGEKISAEEVENLLLQLPQVLNVACVPMPDRVLGEKMCAFIVPRTGQSIGLSEISDYLTREGLGKYKHPERVELVQEFPISNFGKVQKNVLSERIARQLQAEKVEQASRGSQSVSSRY